jgi:hypothetical protein
MTEQHIKCTTAQIGRCGELIVQVRLLKAGIESAAMTTDAGIDLVAYSPKLAQPLTVQVKANEKPKPSGGTGKPAFDWWISETSPAALVALVEMQSERVWLFRLAELAAAAQQKSSGRLHFYMYADADHVPKNPGTHHREFDRFLLDSRVGELFGFANP